MRTGDFIDLLSNEPSPRRTKRVWLFVLAAIGLLIIESYIVIVLGLGVRKDYLVAIDQFPVMMKQVGSAYLALSLLPILPLYFYPETSRTGFIWRIVPFVAVMVGLWIWGISNLGSANLGDAIMGSTYLQCLVVISVMAVPVAVVLILGFRDGATTHPRLAGFLIGVVSGAAAAFLYAFACAEDSPVFYAIWYSVAMFIPGIVGAFIGGRLLKY